MAKKPPDAVNKLIAQAGKNKAAKAKREPTVARRMRLRKPNAKPAPTNVLNLIAQALDRKKGR